MHFQTSAVIIDCEPVAFPSRLKLNSSEIIIYYILLAQKQKIIMTDT